MEEKELTFRLPSFFLRHRLPRGGGNRFSVWFKILYRVIGPIAIDSALFSEYNGVFECKLCY